MSGDYLPTTPGTQLSFEVKLPGRGPRSLLRHLVRHRLKGRRGFACPWCPSPGPLIYVEPPGTQLSFEVKLPGRGPRSLLRHLVRHRLKGRRGFACPWCPPPGPLIYVEPL